MFLPNFLYIKVLDQKNLTLKGTAFLLFTVFSANPIAPIPHWRNFYSDCLLCLAPGPTRGKKTKCWIPATWVNSQLRRGNN